MTRVAIVILAAGASSRMKGRDKLMEPINDRPALLHAIEKSLKTDASVFVTLPAPEHRRAVVTRKTNAVPIYVRNADQGMSVSLRTAISELPAATSAALILPADMPDISTSDLQRTIFAFENDPELPVIQATDADGTPGHPVLFPADCFDAMYRLSGDIGAKPVLMANAHRLRKIALPGKHATTDLDTVEDWQAWRRANPVPQS